jgi:beta-mannosidase
MSPDGRHPKDPTCGDQHPWKVALETAGGTDFRLYRDHIDRFPNEGGVLGASTIPTLKAFLPENEQFIRSFSWDHHDNTFARRDAFCEKLGHAYATIALWTGRNALDMSLEEYAVLSGLLQAEGLEEYIYNYRRRMFSSASAIFWMFNDSWPTTNSWTIIDYYLRRKLAFHPVRRAFAETSAVATLQGGDVVLYGVHDGSGDWCGTLRYGIFNVRGGLVLDERAVVTLKANASTELARFAGSRWQEAGMRDCGIFAILYNEAGEEIAVHRLFEECFGNMTIPTDPEVKLTLENGRLTLLADQFVWKCCLDTDGRKDLPDNAFDLFPGIAKTIPWCGEMPEIRAMGNHFLKK